MNVYGLSGCFILLVLVPLAAVLHERSLRRNGYAEEIDGTIQGNRRLPRLRVVNYCGKPVAVPPEC